MRGGCGTSELLPLCPRILGGLIGLGARFHGQCALTVSFHMSTLKRLALATGLYRPARLLHRALHAPEREAFRSGLKILRPVYSSEQPVL
jgi:hypothetical protein